MQAERIQRKYALTRVQAGDYLLPSNDAVRLYRIARDEGEGWTLWRYREVITHRTHQQLDTGDWSQFEALESHIATRAEAIDTALGLST